MFNFNINSSEPPAIFLSLSEPFNSCYDDDVYEVDIEKEKLLIDDAMPDAYYTLEAIDVSHIKLIHLGTGVFIG